MPWSVVMINRCGPLDKRARIENKKKSSRLSWALVQTERDFALAVPASVVCCPEPGLVHLILFYHTVLSSTTQV
jgi:hypothetical protein